MVNSSKLFKKTKNRNTDFTKDFEIKFFFALCEIFQKCCLLYDLKNRIISIISTRHIGHVGLFGLFSVFP